MDHILTDIENRLLANVPELKYVGMDWGQLTVFRKDEMPPVKFPCSLIDLTTGTFSNIGAGIQEGLLTVTLTFADMSFNPSGKASQLQKDAEMRIYRIMKAAHIALHGWTGGTDYSAFIRTAFTRMIREDGLRRRSVSYTTNWQDSSAMPVYPTVDTPSPKIIVGLKR